VWGCICLFPDFILVIFPAAIYQLIPHWEQITFSYDFIRS
jgi:hypothetical protein